MGTTRGRGVNPSIYLFGLLSLASAVLVVSLALSQPWLGLRFAAQDDAVVVAEVAGVVGVFDGEPREDFEDQWSGNQAFAWTWGAVTSATALFDAGAQAREDFENDWDPATTI